ncbi:MAG: prepilin-type N-terminal cleavage/methylation domain-containing protein [Candidatus Niyogibacteria bacterium]|nr:prepilin-type N-terminal cleavage/methylation domain-containing protein [Candidatus Niyogibacteria bacterium]
MFMRRSRQINKGFTILELLVVIAIIGMLASAIVVLTGQVRAKSRDARREQDIKQIANALELYVTSIGAFPICATEVVIGGAADTCIAPVLVSMGAINALPSDPLGKTTGTCNSAGSYVYCYQSVNGRSYAIHYLLETSSNPGKSAGIQTLTVNP